jgi:hypothetical protein
MRVFVISHDQGVDGGRAIDVRSTEEAAIAFVERHPLYPKLKRDGDRLVWDSLGDTLYVEEFEVGD